jgi:hypothetical protein
MKEIPLTKGKKALVDDSDFEELSKYKWCSAKKGNTFYAVRNTSIVNGKQHTIYMHKVIMNTQKGMDTDHRDGDGLNNQRENLRVCTRLENIRNRGRHKRNTSGYKGVSWYKSTKKWMAQICVNNKHVYLGYFKEKEEAYMVYCEAAKKYHGEFANVK